ncbi:glycoside hydrolase family 99-like domain-containing protein [Mangrovicella endophytica]|uniref:glycoside hydrolase family 99-like domain-containing protein n=1 Tax=Mangrovicella endophytica TaxID=2066697 RepID=UPI0012FFD870|nr:glycoside hydrolase family 99-like domain-containing protein [Mangrovicella endophytica]
MSTSEGIEDIRSEAVTTNGRTAIVVLGMHRSGTSALTRVLSLLGYALPSRLIEANPTNPAGHWEPIDLMRLHDRMLIEAGSRWDDWRVFELGKLGVDRTEAYRGEIWRTVEENYPGGGPIILKEPRIARFAGLYAELLREHGFTARWVLPHRNPIDVIQSLQTRDRMTTAFASLLWLRHTLEAEKATRGLPRAFLSFEALMADWRSTVDKVARDAGLEWPIAPDAAQGEIEAFLQDDLRHHRASKDELQQRADIAGWIKDAYAALMEFETDPTAAGAMATLDRISSEFDAAAPLFGAALYDELAVRDASHAEVLKRMEGDLAELQASVEAAKAARDEIEERLDRGNQDAEQRVAALAERDAALALARSEKESLSAELAKRSAALETSELRIAELGDEMGRLRTAHATREAEAVRLAGDIVARTVEVDELRQQLTAMGGELEREIARRSALEADLAFARAHFEIEFAALTKELADRQADVERLAGEHAHHLHVAERARAATQAELDRLRHSIWWRIGFPWRQTKRAASRIRSHFGRRVGLHASQDIEAVDQGGPAVRWTMKGVDPQMVLGWSGGIRLHRGHYRLTIETPEGHEKLYRPKLYIDSGHGYSENEAALLTSVSSDPKRFVARLTLPNGAVALRFDPSERPGEIVFGNARLRLLPRIQHYMNLASQVMAARRERGIGLTSTLRQGLSMLRRSGVRGLTGALRQSAARAQTLDLSGMAARERGLKIETANYVPITTAEPLRDAPVNVVCFYLPQFHPIAENNRWWGEGFTEWTNVRPAVPQFEGHYQPHVPDSYLGYYDLRDSETQRRQVELAKLYGIGGFCFYFYWFAGKLLLETPTQNYLASSELDLPFCLCWANENWSRRWDGLESEILMAQDHSPEDDLAFIAHVSDYLRDPRNIRVDGKPVLLVYRPSLLPEPAATAGRWRDWCRENGIGEIFLAYTQSFESADPALYGFDAAVEFPPNNSMPPDITTSATPLVPDFATKIYDWEIFPERSRSYAAPEYTLFRSVCPAWDNTARRKNKGTVFANSSPALFEEWFGNAVADTLRRFDKPSERLVFVNAWNEWAEGAHLEPDQRYGFAYLQAVRNVLEQANQARGALLLVTHDAHPHGAQFLALAMARAFKADGFDLYIVSLGEGPLLGDFARQGHFLHAGSASPAERAQFLAEARAAGAADAIVNTVVSGAIVPELKALGFRVVSLIHEMPGVIRDMKQEANAEAVAREADIVVFAADLVSQRFQEIVPIEAGKVVIRPQGVLRPNPYKGRNEEARRLVCERHGLPSDTEIVVSVGYVDHRKGPDLLVEAAAKVIAARPQTVFIWVGHTEREMEDLVRSRIAALGLEDRVLFIGFDKEPMAYYAGASVYALTSREDPFPNVILESAEVGVPVVAFAGASGGSDFIVERGGRLAQAFDTDDFAANVISLLENGRSAEDTPGASLRQYNYDLLHYANGMPRVSVVVPNYNYAHHLVQRLSSIVRQSFPIYEIIVLDDRSSDDSLAVIRRFFADHPGIDWQLVVNEENSGSVFRQWQKGLSRCRGDVVWIAEADDFADEDFLAELVPSFSDPKIVLAFSQSRQVDGTGKVLAPDYLAYTSDISDAWTADYVHDGRDEIAQALAVKNVIPNVSGVLFRRAALESAFETVGEGLYEYRIAGDWVLYMQVLLQGKIRFSHKALNSHRRHAQSVTRSGMAERHLAEVVSAQTIARSLVDVSPETGEIAQAYREHVRTYLDIADDLKLSA